MIRVRIDGPNLPPWLPAREACPPPACPPKPAAAPVSPTDEELARCPTLPGLLPYWAHLHKSNRETPDERRGGPALAGTDRGGGPRSHPCSQAHRTGRANDTPDRSEELGADEHRLARISAARTPKTDILTRSATGRFIDLLV
ncbi:MAG: hypothetical protein IBJ11_00440 [Phycisphaerales bacterium]|nr:hypothetical protein [Phycisphaerales bacterium]